MTKDNFIFKLPCYSDRCVDIIKTIVFGTDIYSTTTNFEESIYQDDLGQVCLENIYHTKSYIFVMDSCYFCIKQDNEVKDELLSRIRRLRIRAQHCTRDDFIRVLVNLIDSIDFTSYQKIYMVSWEELDFMEQMIGGDTDAILIEKFGQELFNRIVGSPKDPFKQNARSIILNNIDKLKNECIDRLHKDFTHIDAKTEKAKLYATIDDLWKSIGEK